MTLLDLKAPVGHRCPGCGDPIEVLTQTTPDAYPTPGQTLLICLGCKHAMEILKDGRIVGLTIKRFNQLPKKARKDMLKIGTIVMIAKGELVPRAKA
jgi:hypothetical protein